MIVIPLFRANIFAQFKFNYLKFHKIAITFS